MLDQNNLGLRDGEEMEILNGKIKCEKDELFVVLNYNGNDYKHKLDHKKIEEIKTAKEFIGKEICGCSIDGIKINNHKTIFLIFQQRQDANKTFKIQVSQYKNFLEEYSTDEDMKEYQFKANWCWRTDEYKKQWGEQ